ncbi:MAG: YbaB/EbfC family nucleoid-associated protein [Deltaproteobacteria bacterium]|jgi:DNA-binding YbaB/EbfC family protein|nr:YbaB/EbfC family nucleoid-associated protein [Gammaproteobacteria bacterium]MBP79064.1 YbaB/EbfC family nucleoid-associated protein [Deltaproteobacteria bacterium]|tara:strand:+ start:12159 stop:12479 length:321 start_codon:yes stop_codon:yes gene_type:complete
MNDLNDLMVKAQELKGKFEESQKNAENVQVTGESGGGLVKVRMNGKYQVERVGLEKSVLTEELTVVEDLIAAAVNSASGKVEQEKKELLGNAMGGINLPDGFKFPF